jgi:NAD(P)-dependent dehydrogenase (short-subunit alcohol dehydrogenase family)
MGRLDGKVAVITGGSSGIGEASARLFHAEGASIVIADIRDDRGEALARELGPRASYIHCDVSVETDVKAAVGRAVARFGGLDVMFNNAGIAGAVGGVEEVAVEAFDRTLAVNLRGVFLGVKHAAPAMRRRGRGSIINTASVAGIRAGYGNHVYSAAKAGVIQFTRSVAMELGEHGIRVNCVLPGFIPTPMIGKARGLSAEEAEAKLRIVEDAFTGAQPIRGPGTPADVARAALWLASDESAFVNGHALVVDGGASGGRMWSTYQESITGLEKKLGRR